MEPPTKKRKTDFIITGIGIIQKPILAGIKHSKYDNKGGRSNKKAMPVFFVRDSGDRYDNGTHRFMVPVSKHGNYFVGSRGNPNLNIHAVLSICINHKLWSITNINAMPCILVFRKMKIGLFLRVMNLTTIRTTTSPITKVIPAKGQ